MTDYIFCISFVSLVKGFSLERVGGRDRMVVRFTTTYMESVPITIKVVSLNPANGKMYSIQHYVIKFVSDLRQFSGFLQVLWFPPSIKQTATIELKYC